ncbi:hypothetical protein BV25DRAFT_356755 [Artomyces pyxidatus]|uniref:Uncharacterized protein n=1 Tax=Artomyces pyxidatus TaxID=48021 RepID=A0ACB8T4T0_9AGAM|nr:hypothetical protein BV25DRAFT_356755 [Artomyces pyxidatus]
MKDNHETPSALQPTRDNLLRELKRLVKDPLPGDQYTLTYSGHSSQEATEDDEEEEDKFDELLITSDLQSIVDNQLRDILVDPLPAGCSFTAFFDSCHSGTMLDLPHHYCNAVYVPWVSKGERRTKTMQNPNTRRYAVQQAGSPARVLPSFARVLERRTVIMPKFTEKSRLLINTRVPASSLPGARGRKRARSSAVSPLRQCDSPTSRLPCEGFCPHDESWRAVKPSVVSLSSCSDAQRSWEGEKGSMSQIVCKYLRLYPRSSYKDLMVHVNFELHEQARSLHEWTMTTKKNAPPGTPPIDGEKDNFQVPELGSLVRLVSLHSDAPMSLIDTCAVEHGR